MNDHTHPIETAGFRGPSKKRSPAQQRRDLLRAARRNRELADAVRSERGEAWDAGGRDMYLADRQDESLTRAQEHKRGLRRDVYREIPELEGREYRGTASLRGVRQ